MAYRVGFPKNKENLARNAPVESPVTTGDTAPAGTATGDGATLIERIRRGEAAIAKARAAGRNVSDWERHLRALKRELADEPVIPVAEWYPEFHRFHKAVVTETPDFDYRWIRDNRPELHAAIQRKENVIDAMGPVRLSEVIETLRQWRALVLLAESERRRSAIEHVQTKIKGEAKG